MKKLTPTQLEAIENARAHGGRLERRAGGFWTYPGVETKEGISTSYRVPVWYVTAQTVRALVGRGVLKFSQWQRNGYGDFAIEATLTEDGR